MCIFSQPVDQVSATRIFARATREAPQFIAYSMNMSAKGDLAMILPIPVRPRTGEKAVTFINLKDCPKLFSMLESGFPKPPTKNTRSRSGAVGSLEKKSLKVQQVGSFEASYVPTIKDFIRLDARFRLPDGTWEQLPTYKGFGFVVFKFKKGANKAHPMAFQFPRANRRKLFFPTVHIHDGKVHEKAKFDHVLYAQWPESDTPLLFGWKESQGDAASFVKAAQTKNLVDGNAHVYRKSMRGMLKNADVLV